MSFRLVGLSLSVLVFTYYISSNYIRRPLAVDRAEVHLNHWLLEYIDFQKQIIEQTDPTSIEYLKEVYRLAQIGGRPIDGHLIEVVEPDGSNLQQSWIRRIMPYLYPDQQLLAAKKFAIEIDVIKPRTKLKGLQGLVYGEFKNAQLLKINEYLAGKGSDQLRLSSIRNFTYKELMQIILDEIRPPAIESLEVFSRLSQVCDERVLQALSSWIAAETNSIVLTLMIKSLRERNDSWARVTIRNLSYSPEVPRSVRELASFVDLSYRQGANQDKFYCDASRINILGPDIPDE